MRRAPYPVHSRAPEGSTVKDPPIQPTPSLRAEAAQHRERGPPSSEFSTNVAELAKASPLIAELLQHDPPTSARSLRSVTRDGDPVTVGDWVIVRQVGEQTRVGRVREMFECLHSGVVFSSVRIMCENQKDAHDDEMTGAVWAAAGDSAERMVLKFESVHIEVAVRSVTHVRDELM